MITEELYTVSSSSFEDTYQINLSSAISGTHLASQMEDRSHTFQSSVCDVCFVTQSLQQKRSFEYFYNFKFCLSFLQELVVKWCSRMT